MSTSLKPAPAPKFIEDLCRFIEEYQWSFNLSRKALNYRYGTDYVVDELQQLYEDFRTTTETIPSGK